MTSAFTTQGMYQLGGGDVAYCSFDFSILQFNHYEKFFNALPNFLYKKVKKVSFNCDFEFNYSKSGHKSERCENIIAESIANKKPKFIPYLVKILKIVLPKTKILKSIEFSSMKIPRGMLSVLLKSIAKCPTLEFVRFINVPVTDDHLTSFLPRINPYQYQEVSFVSCGITSRSIPNIKTFIRKRPTTSIVDRRLSTLCLDGNYITEDEINSVQKLLQTDQDLTDGNGEPDVTIDNATIATTTMDDDRFMKHVPPPLFKPITPNVTKSEKSVSPKSVNSHKLNDSEQIKAEQPRPLVSSTQESDYSDYSYTGEEEEDYSYDGIEYSDTPTNDEDLASQNALLRKRLKNLMQKKKALLYADDVFFVGERAQDLAELVSDMKERAAQLTGTNEN
ncbi:hypothetical protein TVAG_045920 [Trichomonas vaginalis G3]|uniref:Uncharacterized protein n=1 Tax=Trichomonas vaginalis (strain ATCC PRA-98 / G3) TaxID=412133 RepID=A2DMG3_TRIV3|nr:RNI-like family [Trichomonas vaginalis G3]EAY18390.1 hypothetical protein TVAG_045920 [Trichomonas vaginalis G3]KAI5530339.1 RNI-like family [Trichomonas vaginalis G3]|eukprot:XP_001579376.1 hypothetical protein [Trichomonas vaginalis G3]